VPPSPRRHRHPRCGSRRQRSARSGVCHCDMRFLREDETFFPHIWPQRTADLLY
jgi:hypothetical protein